MGDCITCERLKSEIAVMAARLKKIVTLLEERDAEDSDGYCTVEDCECADAWRYRWHVSDKENHARAVAIAEGRDDE